MIGYIDNNLDGMWKPCTEEKFYEIVSSQAVAKTIAAVRAGNKNRKRALPAFIFCGEVDEAAYRNYEEKCRQINADAIVSEGENHQWNQLAVWNLIATDYSICCAFRERATSSKR